MGCVRLGYARDTRVCARHASSSAAPGMPDGVQSRVGRTCGGWQAAPLARTYHGHSDEELEGSHAVANLAATHAVHPILRQPSAHVPKTAADTRAGVHERQARALVCLSACLLGASVLACRFSPSLAALEEAMTLHPSMRKATARLLACRGLQEGRRGRRTGYGGGDPRAPPLSSAKRCSRRAATAPRGAGLAMLPPCPCGAPRPCLPPIDTLAPPA